MGLFGPTKHHLATAGTYDQPVVGESHYQERLERVCGGKPRREIEFATTAELVLDDENDHDDQAVRIDMDGGTVGYLERGHVREYRELVAQGILPACPVVCRAKIFGGGEDEYGDDRMLGVWLDLNMHLLRRAARQAAKDAPRLARAAAKLEQERRLKDEATRQRWQARREQLHTWLWQRWQSNRIWFWELPEAVRIILITLGIALPIALAVILVGSRF